MRKLFELKPDKRIALLVTASAALLLVVALGIFRLNPTPKEANNGVQPVVYQDDSKYRTEKVSIHGHELLVAIADTDALRVQGLSGRQSIAPFDGMLFVFDDADSHPFWMKNMLYSLDAIWFDVDYKSLDLKKDLKPETYPEVFRSSTPSRFVLEVPTGTIDRLGIVKGDILSVIK